MSEMKSPQLKSSDTIFNAVLWVAGGIFLLGVMAFISVLLQSPAATPVSGLLNGLFATNSVQLMWYVTRSAGLTAYLVLWLSMVWGLAVSSKILDRLLHRTFTYDFHQFLSLLAVGFTALHIVVLLADRYLPYSVAQILIPFLSPYRPLWVGIGVFSLYLILLVTITFYIRGKIGGKAFRTIHVLSLVAYLTALAHSLFAGTDSSLVTVLGMYAVTFLVVVFLSVYWVVLVIQKKQQKKVPEKMAVSDPTRWQRQKM
jgi:methionine sulfoxide reductase heme-binding subunit